MARDSMLNPYKNTAFTGALRSVRERTAAVPRSFKKAFLVALDLVVLIGLVWLSFSLRFNRPFIPNASQVLLILAAPLIAIPIFARLGIYRSVLRYLPERAIWTIVKAVTIAVLAWVSLAFLAQATGGAGIPRSIPPLVWIMACIFMVCSRFGAKWFLWGHLPMAHPPRQTLIYGTGDAAIQLVHALRSANERLIVGLVSEDPTLVGMDILGLRVYPPSDIERLITNMGIHEVIITTSAATRDRRELMARLSSMPAKIRVLPPLADIAAGRYMVSSLRDIDIDDLLGRSEVAPDTELLRSAVTGKVVLVTGAAGSIGSAVCRLVAQLKPATLVLLDFNEHGLYQINRELLDQQPVSIVPILGSVTDRRLLDRLMRNMHVDVIFHCAAYKHVTLVEENAFEGVVNNIYGTLALAEAAFEAKVSRFVLISSDKAVHPVGVMGATKRWSELIVHQFAARHDHADGVTVFSSVRFGNVVGSSGSVVPLFKEQIAKGGPVTITDNDMTRYFMSVREAAELIVQSSALSENGDIFLLEMGEPIRIRELAHDMIALAGLSVRDATNPAGDIEIVSIGARRGEKIAEELFYDPASVMTTVHPKILRAKRSPHHLEDFPKKLVELKSALDREDLEAVRSILFDFANLCG